MSEEKSKLTADYQAKIDAAVEKWKDHRNLVSATQDELSLRQNEMNQAGKELASLVGKSAFYVDGERSIVMQRRGVNGPLYVVRKMKEPKGKKDDKGDEES